MKSINVSALKVALILAIFFTSCEKEDKTNITSYTIREVASNTPIDGARVDAYRCLESALQGCFIHGFLSSSSTNKEGNVSFPTSERISSIKINKEKYWDGSKYFYPSSGSTVFLSPIATLKVRFIKDNQHPAPHQLAVVIPTGPEGDVLQSKSLGQPRDTTIYIKGRGNVTNSIQWGMNTGGNDCINTTPPVLVNRFDTAQFLIWY